MIADDQHVRVAVELRCDYRRQQLENTARNRVRTHTDGHRVALRALPDYDELYGVHFDTDPAETTNTPEATDPAEAIQDTTDTEQRA